MESWINRHKKRASILDEVTQPVPVQYGASMDEKWEKVGSNRKFFSIKQNNKCWTF